MLPGSTQLLACLLLPHMSSWGITFSPWGCRIHWVEGKQCLQQPSLMVQSRTPSWAGWQLSEEMSQISTPLQAQKTCCLAQPASSSPAQLFCPQHQHRLQLSQPPCLLMHQLGSCSDQLCPRGPGYTRERKGREGGRAVQEVAACSRGKRGGSCFVAPGSCGSPGKSPSSCPGTLHTHSPPHCLYHSGQHSLRGSKILPEYTRTPTCIFPATLPT